MFLYLLFPMKMKLIFVHSRFTFSIPTYNQGCGSSFSECESTVLTVGQKSKTFSGEKVNKGTNLPLRTYLYRTVQYSVTVSVAEPPLFWIRIPMDPHNRRPHGCRSGSAWTDTDPDPGGEKLRNKTKNCCYL